MCTVQTVLKFSLVQSSQDNTWATSGHALPEIPNRACLYDPGQVGRDAYRDPARNTNSNECLYDAANYPA